MVVGIGGVGRGGEVGEGWGGFCGDGFMGMGRGSWGELGMGYGELRITDDTKTFRTSIEGFFYVGVTSFNSYDAGFLAPRRNGDKHVDERRSCCWSFREQTDNIELSRGTSEITLTTST